MPEGNEGGGSSHGTSGFVSYGGATLRVTWTQGWSYRRTGMFDGYISGDEA